MAKERKPTMMEVKKVVTNVIIRLSHIERTIAGIDTTLASYIEFKKDVPKFTAWINKKMEETNGSESKESGDSSGTTATRKVGEKTPAK